MAVKEFNVMDLVNRILVAKQKLVDEGYDYDRKTRAYSVNTPVIREVIVALQQVVLDAEFR